MINKLIISGRKPKLRGIMSIYLQVINNCLFADKNNLIPITKFGSKWWLYDANYGNDVWQYYFEPTFNKSPLFNDSIDISSGFHTDFLLALNEETQKVLESNVQNGKTCYLKSKSLPPRTEYITKNRLFLNYIIQQYVVMKPDLSNKINQFYNTNMKNKKILGVHIRSTDMKKNNNLQIDDYITEIQKYLKSNDIDYIYLATDTYESLNKMKQNFKNIIHYNCTRQNDYSGIPIHGGDRWKSLNFKSPKLVGDESIIETTLLSKCDHLIHAQSSISMCAIFMNIDLTFTYLLEKE